MMKKTAAAFLLAGLVLYGLSSCGGNEEKKPSTDTIQPNANIQASTDGKTLYEAKCMVCHGAEGNAGVMGAADLSTSKIDHAAAFSVVKNGRNGMKAFGGELNDAETDAVVTYIETLRH